MKILKPFFICISFLVVQELSSQKFFKIDNDLVDEPTFNRGLSLIAQEYNPQIVTYKTFERFKSKDSIIENIAILVMQEEDDEEVYRVFDFLEQPLPDFEFTDNQGRTVSRNSFLGKYTVIGLYKDAGQVQKAHLKSLNKLVSTGNYNALALIAKKGTNEGIRKKASFPVLNECIAWYIKNLSVPEEPKFLVLDQKGTLKYIFQSFPDRFCTATPMDPRNREIFDILR